MANKFNPIGLKPINNIIACDYNGRVNKYYIPSSDTDDLWIYDGVKLTGFSNSDGIPIIAKAASGEELVGSVISIKSVQEKDTYIYRKAGEERIIYVADDPWIEFEAQVNGVITTSDIGKQVDIVVAAGNDATGVSATQLDLATLTTNPAQIKILGILEREQNEFGQYTHVRCIIAKHAFKDISTFQEIIWQRSGNTITPKNAGDTVDLSTGGSSLSCIDFTALGLSVLTGGQVQSTATATETLSFNVSATANAGVLTFLSSAISQVVTFPDGVLSISTQGTMYNAGTAAWTFAALGASSVVSNAALTPLKPGEFIYWVKVSSTKYYIWRKRIDRAVDAGAADYNPSVLTDDTTITANNTAAARNIIISTEDVQSGSATHMRTFFIHDKYGQAAANNLTVSLESGNINGVANFLINGNYGSIILKVDGTNGYIF